MPRKSKVETPKEVIVETPVNIDIDSTETKDVKVFETPEKVVEAKLFEGELMIDGKRVVNIITDNFNGVKGLYEVKLEDGTTTTIEDRLIQTLKHE